MIDSFHILTAAHCVANFLKIRVTLGEKDIVNASDVDEYIWNFKEYEVVSNGPILEYKEIPMGTIREFQVSHVTIHPEYNISVSPYHHDIAVLTLEYSFYFPTIFIDVICLPEQVQIFDNVTATASFSGLSLAPNGTRKT